MVRQSVVTTQRVTDLRGTVSSENYFPVQSTDAAHEIPRSWIRGRFSVGGTQDSVQLETAYVIRLSIFDTRMTWAPISHRSTIVALIRMAYLTVCAGKPYVEPSTKVYMYDGSLPYLALQNHNPTSFFFPLTTLWPINSPDLVFRARSMDVTPISRGWQICSAMSKSIMGAHCLVLNLAAPGVERKEKEDWRVISLKCTQISTKVRF
jgi:hypothetical protein